MGRISALIALKALKKKPGTWRRLLLSLGFPEQCLSGSAEACPFCNSSSTFVWKPVPGGCFGSCTACKVKGGGDLLAGRKLGIPASSPALEELLAVKAGLCYFGRDPDGAHMTKWWKK